MSSDSVSLRDRWRHIIFGTDTPAGQYFDQLLIVAILASVAAVMLDSVQSIHQQYGTWLYGAEWFFTLLFTFEYMIRLWVSDRPLRYARSFFGVVDLLSIIPTYLSLFLPGANYLLTIRALRVLRVFRVLKLAHLMTEANELGATLVRTRRKIGIFMFSVVIVIIIFGSLMYLVEGPANGFTSIPRNPVSAPSLAALYGHPAVGIVVTGIVTAEMSKASMARRYERECPNCHRHDHDPDARFCKQCGTGLPKPGQEDAG